MNNKKIRTYSDLVEEKERLETLLTVQKQQMKNNWAEMKEEFKPVQNTFHFLGKLTRRDKSNPLINFGIDVAGDVFLRRILLAKADWVTRLLLPVFVKNLSSNALNKPGSLIQKIKSLWKKQKHPAAEEQFTERDLSEPEIESGERSEEPILPKTSPAYSSGAERTSFKPE